MRKIIVLVALLFSLSYSLRSEVDLGVIGGANIANLDFESTSEFDSENRTALALGLFLNLQASEFLSLQITPMYLQKGANGNSEMAFSEFSANYFEIPILGRANFDLGTLKPYLLLGPSVGFRLGSDIVVNGSDEEVSDKLNSLDFSLMFGGGLEIELDGLSLFGQLTYAYGLSDLNNDGTIEFSDKIYTRGVGIYVGASIPFGKQD